MKYVFMECDLRLRYEYNYGDHYVWDLQHFKLAHALKITHLLKKILYVAQVSAFLNIYYYRYIQMYILQTIIFHKHTYIYFNKYLLADLYKVSLLYYA